MRSLLPQRRASAWLNAVIALLLATLFFLSGLYVVGYVRASRAQTEAPFDMRFLSASAQEISRGIDRALLAPQAIAIRTGGVCRAVLNSGAVIGEMYDALADVWLSAASGAAETIGEDVWREAVAHADGVWISYAAELPIEVIAAFAAAGEAEEKLSREERAYLGVAEWFLLPDGSGRLATVLAHGSGGACRFIAADAPVWSEYAAVAATYANVFYGASLTAAAHGGALIVTDRIEARRITAANSAVLLLTQQTADNVAFLRLLSFNPDKLNEHTEADGTRVCVESHGVLRMDASSVAYTAAEGGGIPIAAWNGADDGADVYGYLRAASNFLRQLEQIDAQYSGGDAQLRLARVGAADGAIELSFAFRYENVPVLREAEDTALVMSFRGDCLTALTYRPLNVRSTLTNRRTVLADYARRVLSPDAEAAVRLVYRAENQGVDSLAAEWLVTPYAEEREWAGTN